MRLYQAEWCSFSHRVRAKLIELGIDYEIVNVSASGKRRAELEEVAGRRPSPCWWTVTQEDVDVIEGIFSRCTSSASIGFLTSRKVSLAPRVTAAAVQRAIMESLP